MTTVELVRVDFAAYSAKIRAGYFWSHKARWKG